MTSPISIVPPMTTPFSTDDTLDEAALRAETRYLIETARVHGLAVAGSTGEGHALDTDEVRRITAIVPEEARGRVPVICVDLWNSAQTSDHKRALALHEALLPIWNAINGDNLPANVRYCQELQGQKAGVPRAPMPPTSPQQQGPIRRALEAAGLL